MSAADAAVPVAVSPLVETPSGRVRARPSRLPQRLQAVRQHALALVRELQALTTESPTNQHDRLAEYIGQVQDMVHFVESDVLSPPESEVETPSLAQLRQFGQLLRDKRNAAGLSRVELARKAKLSDATIKFIETAKHPPSRATLIRLLGVEALGLCWEDVALLAPGQQPPAPLYERPVEKAETGSELNCYLTPSYDPVRMVMDLGRFLNGAGGHVEQTNAYLDHQSAADYMAMCQQSPVAAAFRASTPLQPMAKRIVEQTGSAGINLIALGVGDGALEVRLVQHLLDEMPRPDIELCMLDISQPLLSVAYKRAADAFSGHPGVHVWGMQCNFHHLPLYTQLYYTPARLQRRRLFAMLGNTLANLDNEPRFFQHALLGCAPGDLLIVDFQLSAGQPDAPEEIKRRDRTWLTGVSGAHQGWLSGPVWRHCKDVNEVKFHWQLETQCPVPGSYALGAVATVRSRGRADRQFSMFRFKRYDADQLAECLASCGWDRVAQIHFGCDGNRAAVIMLCRKREDTP
ncbi:MAG: L-histidine N(alpha)-methyltransferase [Polyangia bacterium]